MGIYETLKDIVSAASKLDNVEVMRRVMELQTQCQDLESENRALKERLSTHSQLIVQKNAYWRGNDGPFCTKCWDVESRLVRLHVRKNFHPKCPSCGNIAVDPEYVTPQPVRRRSRSPYLDRG